MKSLSKLICILLILISCSEKSDTTNSSYPDGSIWKNQTIKFEFAPANFTAMLIWAQAATMKSDQPTSTKAVITIDYWKIIENVGTQKTEIYIEHYDYSTPKTFSINEAGLYCRFPSWFDASCNDQHDFAYNMSAVNSYLSIDVSQTPSKIIHWWTPRQVANPNTTYSIEVRLKVEGSTAIQFGLDYWRTLTAPSNGFDPNCVTSNNCEAWISNWVGDTQGQFITVTLPNR
jgi:hypothetical protein